MYIKIIFQLNEDFLMKKMALALLGVAMLVSHATAACAVGTNGTTGCCRWDNDPENCWGVGGTYDETKTQAACEADFGQYVMSCDEELKTPLGCCAWNTEEGKCWTIYAGEDADGKDGAAQALLCQGGTNVFWNGACPTTSEGACPTTKPVYDGKSQAEENGYCCYEPNSYNENNGYCGLATGDASPEECVANGGVILEECPAITEGPNVTCGATPILGNTLKLGLIVAPFGNSLHISSDRNATISLYDMKGKEVLTGKVNAGNSVFDLDKKVSMGSYYAVVKAGSNTQKVNVIIK